MVAKYRKIADELREKVLAGAFEEGSSIPTEQTLQSDYQVSRYTVRQAIALLVNEGLLVSERGSGTFVAKREVPSLGDSKKHIKIGILLTSLSDYIFPEIISGIERTLRENKCSMILSSSNNDFTQEKECLKSFENQGIDALIMEPSQSNCYNPNLSEYLRIRDLGIPIVFINSQIDLLDIPTVRLDDVASAKALTEALFKQNHEKVAIVTNWEFRQGKDRFSGFVKAHLDAHKLFTNDDVFCFNSETKETIVEQIATYLKETSLVTGLICYNDEFAAKLIHYLYDNDPDRLSHLTIASFDYSKLGRSYPIQLSVEHPKYFLGEKAASIILENLIEDSPKELKSYFFKPNIISK
ncbi:GntR family transcriptional regulator [Streptococcus pluranimalium]